MDIEQNLEFLPTFFVIFFAYLLVPVMMTYLKTKEMRLTATTSRSSMLKPLLQKLPVWSINPYATILNKHSIVKIVVKK